MLIGEGPGKDEEKEGRPFVGRSGQVLQDVLHSLNMHDLVYITNVVACRSCAHDYDNDGQPKFYDNGNPVIKDQAPLPTQVQKCEDRLYEEIYLVDPILIVTLGASSASKLLNRAVTVTSECGTTHAAKIPGAAHVASLTDKKKAWRRKVKGEWVQPIVQNQVEYQVMVNLHPAYVARLIEDRRPGAPMEQFYRTLERARNIYQKYCEELAAL
jgi:uracil-DNA glycosylase